MFYNKTFDLNSFSSGKSHNPLPGVTPNVVKNPTSVLVDGHRMANGGYTAHNRGIENTLKSVGYTPYNHNINIRDWTEPFDGKRSMVNRIFSVIGSTNYVVAGFATGIFDDSFTPLEGASRGLVASNPFGKGRDDWRYSYTDTLTAMGWKPETGLGKVAKFTTGLAMDIFLDPGTYITGGIAGAMKGSGKHAFKGAMKADSVSDIAKAGRMTQEMAESIVRSSGIHKSGRFALDVKTEATEFARKFNSVYGVYSKDAGVRFSLSNAPLGRKIFKERANTVVSLTTSDSIKAFGDNTIAPIYGAVRNKIYGSRFANLFSNNSKLYSIGKENPAEFYNYLKHIQMQKGIDRAHIATKKLIRNRGERLLDLSPSQSREVIDLLESPSKWNKIEKTIDSLETKEAVFFKNKIVSAKKATSVSLDDLIKKQEYLNNFKDINKKLLGENTEVLRALEGEMTTKLLALDGIHVRDMDKVDDYLKAIEMQNRKLSSNFKGSYVPEIFKSNNEKLLALSKEKEEILSMYKGSRVPEVSKSIGQKIKYRSDKLKDLLGGKSGSYVENMDVEFINEINKIDENISKITSSHKGTLVPEITDFLPNLSKNIDDLLVEGAKFDVKKKFSAIEDLSYYAFGNSNAISQKISVHNLEPINSMIKRGADKREIVEYMFNRKDIYGGKTPTMYNYIAKKIGYKSWNDDYHKAIENMLGSKENYAYYRKFLSEGKIDQKSLDALAKGRKIESKTGMTIHELLDIMDVKMSEGDVLKLIELEKKSLKRQLLVNEFANDKHVYDVMDTITNLEQSNLSRELDEVIDRITDLDRLGIHSKSDLPKGLERFSDNLRPDKTFDHYLGAEQIRHPYADVINKASSFTEPRRQRAIEEIHRHLSSSDNISKAQYKFYNEITYLMEDIYSHRLFNYHGDLYYGEIDYGIISKRIDPFYMMTEDKNLLDFALERHASLTASKRPIQTKKMLENLNAKKVQERISTIKAKSSSNVFAKNTHDSFDSFYEEFVNRHDLITDYMRDMGRKLSKGFDDVNYDLDFIHPDSYNKLIKRRDSLKDAYFKNTQRNFTDLSPKDVRFVNKTSRELKPLMDIDATKKDFMSKVEYNKVLGIEDEAKKISKMYDESFMPPRDLETYNRNLDKINELLGEKDGISKRIEDVKNNLSINKAKINELESNINKITKNISESTQTSIENAEDIRYAKSLIKEFDDSLSSVDNFETYVRANFKGDFTFDRNAKTVGDYILKHDATDDKLVREVADNLRKEFLDMGLEELKAGKLTRQQYLDMSDKYFPRQLTDEGKKAFLKNRQFTSKPIRSFGADFGYGRTFSPSSVRRTMSGITLDGEFIENPTIAQYNRFYKELLGSNVYEEDLAKVYVARALKHNDLMYDNKYMESMSDIFGRTYDGVVNEGESVVLNYGKLKQVTNDYAKFQTSMDVSDFISNALTEGNVIEEAYNISRKLKMFTEDPESLKRYLELSTNVEIPTYLVNNPDELIRLSQLDLKNAQSELIKGWLERFYKSERFVNTRDSIYRGYLENFLSSTKTTGLLDEVGLPLTNLNDAQTKSIDSMYKSMQYRYKEFFTNKIKDLHKGVIGSSADIDVDKLNYDLLIDDLGRHANKLDNPVLSQRLESLINISNNYKRIEMPKYSVMNNNIIESANQTRLLQLQRENNNMLNLYDKFLHLIKINQTSVLPGFHARNKMTNRFQMWLSVGNDALDVNFSKQAKSVIRNTNFDENIITNSGKTISWREVYNKAIDYKVIDTGLYGSEISGSVSEGLLKNVKPHLDPTDSKNFFIYKKGTKVGRGVENHDRLTHFASLVKSGKTYEEAKDIVAKFNFDYSDLTLFEQSVMKRVIPYYTFVRKNMPLQLENILEQPEKYRLIGKFTNGIESMVLEEDRVDKRFLSAYASEWLQTPFTVSNQRGGRNPVLLNPNLPFLGLNDIPDVFNPGDYAKGIFNQTSPIFKTPIEQALNKNFFFDSPIVRDGSTTGQAIGARAKHITNQIGVVPMVSGLANKQGVSKGMHLLSNTTGVKLSSYDYDMFKAMKIKELQQKRDDSNTNEGILDAIRRRLR